MEFGITRSRTGLPVISEAGGGMTNTGGARIVAGKSGEKLKPLYIPKGLSNGDHALFVVREGMHVICAGHNREGDKVTAYRVTEIHDDYVQAEEVGMWENGDGDIPSFLRDAVEAALDKSHTYHCRRVFYAAE